MPNLVIKRSFVALALFFPLLVIAQTNVINTTGNVGIGTTAPRAMLDIGLPITATNTAVLGRLPEGNDATGTGNGTGTYLGIQTYNTTPINSISFALEHRYYSLLNSSINFYRGSATTGGFMTFTTGSGIERLRIDGNGNIGIGTTAPSDRFTIDNGSTRNGINIISDGDASVYSDLKFTIKNTTPLATGVPTVWLASCRKDGYFTNDLTGPTLEFYALKKGGSYVAPLLFKANGDIILAGARNATNGNVGIGVLDTQGYKLAVGGTMIAEKIKVKLQTAWPDFVFEKEYQLPSLTELAKYIADNKHLPGVPTAAEVKDGMDVGEMNKVLLQKVEELTLHLIEQQEQIKKMQAEINSLK